MILISTSIYKVQDNKTIETLKYLYLNILKRLDQLVRLYLHFENNMENLEHITSFRELWYDVRGNVPWHTVPQAFCSGVIARGLGTKRSGKVAFRHMECEEIIGERIPYIFEKELALSRVIVASCVKCAPNVFPLAILYKRARIWWKGERVQKSRH